MAQINAYLTFNGNCGEAFEFYKTVFGGSYRVFSSFGDMPATPGYEVPASEKNKIMHVSLPISKETILMGSDTNAMHGDVVIGQNISLSVNTHSKEEAGDIFNKLAAGGQITMPIADTFWSAYFGMLVDKFGILWMVNYDAPKG